MFRIMIASVVLLASVSLVVALDEETTVGASPTSTVKLTDKKLVATTPSELVKKVSEKIKDLNQTATGAIQLEGNGTVNLNARSRNVLNQPGSSHTATGTASSSNSLIIILVSLIVVACVITLILAALFVMRHRFNFLRLNRGGGGGKDDVESNDKNGDEDGDQAEKVVVENETEKATVDSVVKNAENGETVVGEKKEETSANAETPLLADEKAENGDADKSEVKTYAEAVTQDTNNEVKTYAEAVAEPATTTTTTTTTNTAAPTATTTTTTTSSGVTEQNSSSSLIANVLNDLSESVVCKLAAKSPTKSSDDPEKQPLNSETN